MRRGCRGGACCRKIPSVPNANGIFGIIRSVKRIRALIGSRETWKISYVRVGKEGIRLWARFLRRLVQGFPGPLLKRGREQRPLSLPAKQARAKERKRKMGTTGARGARGSSHAFAFYGGELLNKMGAAWFVSYAYHEHVDATHENWNRTATASGRIRRYNNTFSYHRYWLDKVMTMNDQNLAKNTIGLTPREIKDMANAVMSENW